MIFLSALFKINHSKYLIQEPIVYSVACTGFEPNILLKISFSASNNIRLKKITCFWCRMSFVRCQNWEKLWRTTHCLCFTQTRTIHCLALTFLFSDRGLELYFAVVLVVGGVGDTILCTNYQLPTQPPRRYMPCCATFILTKHSNGTKIMYQVSYRNYSWICQFHHNTVKFVLQ